jgi:hypothetical protein
VSVNGDADPVSPQLFRPLRAPDRSQSQQARDRRQAKARAHAPPLLPRPEITSRTRALRKARTYPRLTIPRSEQIAMAASLTDSFYTEASGERARQLSASARKNLATAYAICQDKLALLLGRPTDAPAVELDPTRRAALLALGSRLAAVSDGKQGGSLGTAS